MTFIKRNLRPGLKTNRIESFSDGVFAISITLLVLTIAIPQLTQTQVSSGLLFQSLINLWPKLLSFFISFIVIGIFWMGHIIMFNFIKRSDRVLLWLNVLLLLMVSFIPFPAALIGEYSSDKYAVILYGLTLTVLGFLYLFLWLYASHNFKLIDKSTKPEIIKKATYAVLVAPVSYLIAILIAFYNSNITILIYIVIPILYIIPSPIDEFVDYVFEEETS
ncbi:MAG TPA: TMEM175 family protein [Candidatus Sulfotelmatobacter sp.]|nr:TMEM175 family protein [Candidatus Sulfotelmatobacter sp.]